MDRRNNIEMKDDRPGLVIPPKNVDDPFDINEDGPASSIGAAAADAVQPAAQINMSESEITHDDDVSDGAPHGDEADRRGVGCAVGGKSPSKNFMKQ